MMSVLLVTLLAVGSGALVDQPEVVSAKIGLCAACHGTDGRSLTPAAPHIGGQNEAYLVWALTQYREGRREGDVMNNVIDVLSRKDIEDLAHWYARQRWPALDAVEHEAEP